MAPRILVFDVDGVLVDVSESYRETIQQTVEHFTGSRPTRELIQDFKNQGGWNDDWDLSHRLIADLGAGATFDEVVDRFNRLFLGNNGDGLILRERWLAGPGLLERLRARFRLAIFTGRRQYEIEPTLARFGAGGIFDPIVTAEMVARLKPAPDGLIQIAARHPGAAIWYVGDTVDDARAARAAGVPFIGVAALSNPRRRDLVAALKAENAATVIEDINQLEAVLPQ